MARVQKFLSLAAGFCFVLLLSLFVTSCEETTEPGVPDEFIQGDIFPLTVGNKITYSGYLRHQVADTNITSTGAVYNTTWTVVVLSAPMPTPPVGPGGTGTLVADTTTVPTGVPNPPTVKVYTPLFIKKEANGSFSYLTSIGRFKRQLGISGTDTLKLILLADASVALGKTWSAYDSTFAAPSVGTARLEIVGKWEGKETLTLNGATFNTYKLTATRNVYLAGSSTPAPGSGALTATVWVAAGIGPVKMILNADGESYGHYREYLTRNF
ncbi:MAG: hypothetical protein HYY49_06700 [Ignavibacteriales bacterium]|nr:hypothetical protein [Ignavibacteriales bacterium]